MWWWWWWWRRCWSWYWWCKQGDFFPKISWLTNHSYILHYNTSSLIIFIYQSPHMYVYVLKFQNYIVAFNSYSFLGFKFLYKFILYVIFFFCYILFCFCFTSASAYRTSNNCKRSWLLFKKFALFVMVYIYGMSKKNIVQDNMKTVWRRENFHFQLKKLWTLWALDIKWYDILEKKKEK